MKGDFKVIIVTPPHQQNSIQFEDAKYCQVRKVAPHAMNCDVRLALCSSLLVKFWTDYRLANTLVVFVYTNHPPSDIPSLLMAHTICLSYNRICLILKKLNRHIQYGHHFKALGMYFETFMAKCNSIWSFLSEVSPANRNDLQPADSAAICISHKLVPLPAPGWEAARC